MKTLPTPDPYKRHRFPAEIISHGVWLYFCFCLSSRDIEERNEVLSYSLCVW
jgi:transposase-like protein